MKTFSLLSQLPANTALASCSFVASVSDETGAWQQILPGKDFAAYDGRPDDVPGGKWRIDNASGERLAQLLNSRAAAGDELLFDYEHQTLLARQNGQKAPASGRANKFEWRPGEGLFAYLRYTPIARQHVKDKEYSLFSPVIIYDKATGQVNDIHSVALTNDPAIKGMASAALSFLTQPPENTMNKSKLALLFSVLGLTAPETTEDAQLIAALTSEDAIAALEGLKDKLSEAENKTTEIATLKAQVESGGDVDLAKFVPIDTYNGLVTEMAALKASNGTLTVDKVIEDAQKAGKFIAEAEIDYLTKLGEKDLSMLTSTLAARPVVAALTGKQTTEKPPIPQREKIAALTAEQEAVAKQLGISNEDYLAHLNQ
ncbi:phage protease [Glaciecola sp. 1036]|uniref:phage protease n=1 Tax=Alteromonadaceae TaxID=72275 RepID=UPI003CFF8909